MEGGKMKRENVDIFYNFLIDRKKVVLLFSNSSIYYNN